MDVLQYFKNEFDELVSVAYGAYWELDTFPKNKFSIALQDAISDTLLDKKRTFNLTREDLEQQLALFWLSYTKQYHSKKTKPGTSLKIYLIRRSIWGLRDWLRQEINIVTEEYRPFEEKLEIDNDFKIDLMFLFHGIEASLLKDLSPYERYLIFLKFKEDKSILQMSYILQKDRRIIKNHIDSIIIKLKENHSNGLQNEQNSRGYRH